MSKRMKRTLSVGAILGVLCIIGASLRYQETIENWYLFAFWFNRLLMGFVIGLLSFNKSIKYILVRGFIIGLIVSFAFYSATNYQDLPGFLVGGVYGMIIEFTAYKLQVKYGEQAIT